MNGLPLLPAITVEFIGSALAILLSFMALGYARALVRLQPNNFIWGFLFYFCIAMTVFSLSRGVGHIVRIILVYNGRNDLWKLLAPWSGGFNTMLLISVAAVTIYYHKGLAAYKAIRLEAEKLSQANAKLAAGASQLQQLNANLEHMVKERTNQLINHEKMASVGNMAAGIAHEINTPLGIILGYSQLMMDDFSKDSESYASLEIIERQTKTCRRIVTDLLKFSRQSESMKTSLDINEIIREVLSVTEHTLNIHRIQVERRFASDMPMVIGDAEKLRQVFINLFNNAQYAMPDGGELIIVTERAFKEVQVTVQDNGTGVADEIKNKIFDPFFTTKEVGEGTGLGLSVSYGIVQEHGGSITIESPIAEPETKKLLAGTAVRLRFPAETNNAIENGGMRKNG